MDSGGLSAGLAFFIARLALEKFEVGSCGALLVALAFIENGDVCDCVAGKTDVGSRRVTCEAWVLAFECYLHSALDRIYDVAALSQCGERPAVSD